MELRANGIGPIDAAHLLRRVDEKLIELLRSLTPEEWELPTIASRWTVRDVAAHLLDTPLRKLSMARDACFVETNEIRSQHDLVQLIDRLNQEGVTVYRRLSPPVLIEMMKLACEQSARFHESLDPFAPAKFAVSWAGEGSSLNWFDTARELTERWHHQQQMRLATNRPGIMSPELYHPVLDCFLRGLPYAYRNTAATTGAAVEVEISGECGGSWYLVKGPESWVFGLSSSGEIAATVSIPQELAWRLFTKGLSPEAAREHVELRGDRALGEVVLRFTAIVG